MLRIIAFTLLLLTPLAAAQSIYRTTDEAGNVVFTDAPSADSRAAEPVGLQPTNTTPPPRARPALKSPADTPEVTRAYYTIAITSPANETSIPRGHGDFTVTVAIQPALKKYESLQLFMNDEPSGSSQASMIWDLTNVFRGAHDITVGAIDRSGKTIAMSDPVRVYVHRPSINFRK